MSPLGALIDGFPIHFRLADDERSIDLRVEQRRQSSRYNVGALSSVIVSRSPLSSSALPGCSHRCSEPLRERQPEGSYRWDVNLEGYRHAIMPKWTPKGSSPDTSRSIDATPSASHIQRAHVRTQRRAERPSTVLHRPLAYYFTIASAATGL